MCPALRCSGLNKGMKQFFQQPTTWAVLLCSPSLSCVALKSREILHSYFSVSYEAGGKEEWRIQSPRKPDNLPAESQELEEQYQ